MGTGRWAVVPPSGPLSLLTVFESCTDGSDGSPSGSRHLDLVVRRGERIEAVHAMAAQGVPGFTFKADRASYRVGQRKRVMSETDSKKPASKASV